MPKIDHCILTNQYQLSVHKPYYHCARFQSITEPNGLSICFPSLLLISVLCRETKYVTLSILLCLLGRNFRLVISDMVGRGACMSKIHFSPFIIIKISFDLQFIKCCIHYSYLIHVKFRVYSYYENIITYSYGK